MSAQPCKTLVEEGPSTTGMLVCYALLATAVTVSYGTFRWEALALLLGAAAVAARLHLRPALRGRWSEEALLLGLLLASLAIMNVVAIGHTLQRVVYRLPGSPSRTPG